MLVACFTSDSFCPRALGIVSPPQPSGKLKALFGRSSLELKSARNQVGINFTFSIKMFTEKNLLAVNVNKH